MTTGSGYGSPTQCVTCLPTACACNIYTNVPAVWAAILPRRFLTPTVTAFSTDRVFVTALNAYRRLLTFRHHRTLTLLAFFARIPPRLARFQHIQHSRRNHQPLPFHLYTRPAHTVTADVASAVLNADWLCCLGCRSRPAAAWWPALPLAATSRLHTRYTSCGALVANIARTFTAKRAASG